MTKTQRQTQDGKILCPCFARDRSKNLKILWSRPGTNQIQDLRPFVSVTSRGKFLSQGDKQHCFVGLDLGRFSKVGELGCLSQRSFPRRPLLSLGLVKHLNSAWQVTWPGFIQFFQQRRLLNDLRGNCGVGCNQVLSEPELYLANKLR